MGHYDLYSSLVLGFRVPVSVQARKVSERGCEHNLVDKLALFCNTCAEPVHTYLLGKIYEMTGARGKYQVSRGNDEGRCYFVGIPRQREFTLEDLKGIDFEAVQADIAACLENVGVNPLDCHFGLHKAIFHSDHYP